MMSPFEANFPVVTNIKASSFCYPSEQYNSVNTPQKFNPGSFCYPSEQYNSVNTPQKLNPGLFSTRPLIPNDAFTPNHPPSTERPYKKHYKSKGGKDDIVANENQFAINFDKIVNGKDKRTTLMIRNIPNKYTVNALLLEINTCFEGKFDFLYLPLDYKNNCNLGFAFINFTNPLHILMFYEIFLDRKWKNYNSVKKCDLTYAKSQGKKELASHFEKGCNSKEVQDDKKPIILTPMFPLPKVEVPVRFLEAFKKCYKNLQYDLLSDMKFVIKSLF